MQLVANKNPLMSSIQYNGQIYFTSQYFHQQYRANSGASVKYEQLPHFNRLIRSIETYQNYIERNDIVELIWKKAKKITDPSLGSVFKAVNYNPIMLINATAQVALTHHLDDEISKQVSVEVNTKTAINTTALPLADTAKQAADLEDLESNFETRIRLATLCGLRDNQAITAANKWTQTDDGIDVLAKLGLKTMPIIEPIKNELTATELGTLAGLPGNGRGKGINTNLALWALGYLDDALDHHRQPAWKISQQGLGSGLLYYAKSIFKQCGESETKKIVYRPNLISVLKETNLTQQDYQDLKSERTRKPAIAAVK